MASCTYSDLDIAHLSPGAISDLTELYRTSAPHLEKIAEMSGEIGRLARICIFVGQEGGGND